MSKFKNGDKVRIVKTNYAADKFRVGDVGRVYEVERLTGMFCPEGHNPEIPHDDLEGTLCFPLSSLELTKEDTLNTTPKEFITAGSKVECINGQGTRLKSGKIYTVSYINDGYLYLEEDPDKDSGWFEWRFKLVEDDQESEVTTPEVQPNTLGGIKFDQGKVDYTYLLKDLPVSVEEVTKVLIYGANKYSRSNYSKVESERYEAAFFRHVMAYLRGEQLDPETGYHHLAHAVCCLMFLVEREVKKEEK